MNYNGKCENEILKIQSRKSGLSYNEAKEWIAKTTGGRNTHVYSDTDSESVRQKNNQSAIDEASYRQANI